MASGQVYRANRPNTWLHRPMLQAWRKLLPTRSRPHMAHRVISRRCGNSVALGAKRTSGGHPAAASEAPPHGGAFSLKRHGSLYLPVYW